MTYYITRESVDRVILMCAQGHTMDETVESTGLTKNQVEHVSAKTKIRWVRWSRGIRPSKKDQERYLPSLREAAEQGLTRVEAAAYVGLTVEELTYISHKNGISWQRKKNYTVTQKMEARQLYAEGMRLRDISGKIGIPYQTTWHIVRRLAASIVIGVGLTWTDAYAHDHDPGNDAWYSSLKQPGSGASCCNLQDCHPIPDNEWKTVGDKWMVYASKASFGQFDGDEKWHEVPNDKFLRGKENPTGMLVVCAKQYGGVGGYMPSGWTVLCAVKPSGV